MLSRFIRGTSIAGFSIFVSCAAYIAFTFIDGVSVFSVSPRISVARDAYDCEILRIARKIKAGDAPNFVALKQSKSFTPDTMILRAFDNFWNSSALPDNIVWDAYRTVDAEMQRQEQADASISKYPMFLN